MTVQEALAQCCITTLKAKYKEVMHDAIYGQILSTDKNFPRNFEHFDWITRPHKYNPEKYSGQSFALVTSFHTFDQAFLKKMVTRTAESINEYSKRKPFLCNPVFIGAREPNWENHDPRCYYILYDFIKTFWGQDMINKMIADNNSDKREGSPIDVYFNPETRLTIIDGKLGGFPMCLFIAPETPETI